LQEVYGKVAAKVSVTLKKYVSDNGYTLLLDVSSQQSNVMWANQSTDVTQAVVDGVQHLVGRRCTGALCALLVCACSVSSSSVERRLRRQQHQSNSP